MITKLIGLIPARSGSKRCAGKNTRPFFGLPLLVYTIRAAQQALIFDDIVVSTDSQATIEIAISHNCDAILRPDNLAGDYALDQEWIVHAISCCEPKVDAYSHFAILRPTSPFRSPALITSIWDLFLANADKGYTSVRTVEQGGHPGKMWLRYRDLQIEPLFGRGYDSPTQLLHRDLPIFTQNGCLQIAKTSLLPETITGNKVLGYEMTGNLEGFDINTEADWILAEELVKRGLVKLPKPTVI